MNSHNQLATRLARAFAAGPQSIELLLQRERKFGKPNEWLEELAGRVFEHLEVSGPDAATRAEIARFIKADQGFWRACEQHDLGVSLDRVARRHASLAVELARAFVSGPLEIEELVHRGSVVLNKRWSWLRSVALRIVDEFGPRARPRSSRLAEFLRHDRGFLCACDRYGRQLKLQSPAPPAEMCPARFTLSSDLPTLQTSVDLADWLGIRKAELAGYADLQGQHGQARRKRIRHYHYRVLAKRFGRVRLIESPKPRLKAIQRELLEQIVDCLPPHPAAHGFRRGRSIATMAAPHVGRQVVLKIDLEDFFPSISRARVQAVFRAGGYPEHVADLLGGLCTTSADADAWEFKSSNRMIVETIARYRLPHLPQGAPPRRRWRTCARFDSIVASRASRPAREPAIRVMPTIWSFPAMRTSLEGLGVSQRMRRQRPWRKVSTSIIARRGSCARVLGNKSWACWSTGS